MVRIVRTGKPYVLLNKKGERNLHHLGHLFFPRLKTRFYFNYVAWRANIYENHDLERLAFPARI
jgi:hypothetical protein